MNPLCHSFYGTQRFVQPYIPSINSAQLSLSFLQQKGIFVEQPNAKVNKLTKDDLLNCSLLVTKDGKYALLKEGKIIACDPDWNNFPTSKSIAKAQSKDLLILRMKLNKPNEIDALMPYLNAIPLYKCD